jgi:hypothetical protein
MSLLHADSFDISTAKADVAARYDASTTTNMQLVAGKTANAYQPGNNGYLQKTITTGDVSFVGFALKVSFNGGTQKFLALMDGATEQVYLTVQTDGKIRLYNGDGTLLGTSTDTPFTAATWIYVELGVTIHNSAGTFELRFNGVSEFSGSGADTQNSAAAQATALKFGLIGSNNDNLQIDDLYVCDDAGSLNNTFLGPIAIPCKLPSGNGTTNSWTRGGADSGTNAGQVDEASQNGNTDYVLSGNVGDYDLYAFADLADTTSAIKGVVVTAWAEKDDALARTMANVVRSGAANYDQSANSLTNGTYTPKVSILETDPATAAAWAATAVNSAEFGVKVTA